MENIQALEIKDGIFEAGKIHTSYVGNLTTLAFYIQTPILWELYCESEPEASQVLKEGLVSLVRHWQSLIKEQGLAEETTLTPENI